MLGNNDDYQTKENYSAGCHGKLQMSGGLRPPVSQSFIASGLIVVRNTPTAKHFIEKWRDICARRDYAFLSYDSKAEISRDLRMINLC